MHEPAQIMVSFAAKFAVGGIQGFTVMNNVFVIVSEPFALIAINETV